MPVAANSGILDTVANHAFFGHWQPLVVVLPKDTMRATFATAAHDGLDQLDLLDMH
jgi:hypothetical protein